MRSRSTRRSNDPGEANHPRDQQKSATREPVATGQAVVDRMVAAAHDTTVAVPTQGAIPWTNEVDAGPEDVQVPGVRR